MTEVAVLMSGGLDSTALLAHVRQTGVDAEGVWYDHGQAARFREALALPQGVTQRQLPWSGQNVPHGTARDAFYLPGRNGLLLLAMICQHRPRCAMFGSLVNEQRPSDVDRNAHFRALLAQLASYMMEQPITIAVPLADLGFDKALLIRHVLDEKLMTEAQLRQTYSCYHDTPQPYVGCGSCRPCLRRYLLFNGAGLREPASAYVVDPLRGAWAEDMARLLEQDRDELWGNMPRSSLAWAEAGLKLGATGRLRVELERLLAE